MDIKGRRLSRLAVSSALLSVLGVVAAGPAKALPVSVETVSDLGRPTRGASGGLPLTGIEVPAATAAGALLISIGMLMETKQRTQTSGGKAEL